MEETPKQSLNTIFIYVLSALVIGLLGFIGYTYKSEPLNSSTQHASTFETLPSYIQEQYVAKSDMLEMERKLQEATKKAEELQQNNFTNTAQKAQPQITSIGVSELGSSSQNEIVIKEKVVEKVITKPIKIDKTNYETFTCKNFDSGGIVIPRGCEENLIKFLEEHKNSKLLEIIGLVDDTEFKLIKNLEDVYGIEKIKDIKKYVQRGLSRQRVIEMTWLIKEYFHKQGNFDFNLNAVNYTLYSKDKRGFVIKAYY